MFMLMTGDTQVPRDAYASDGRGSLHGPEAGTVEAGAP